MFYSSSANILFIAAPKTGSTSVEKILLDMFSDGACFKIQLSEKTITSADVESPSLGHAKAFEFNKVLGDEYYHQLFVFGFVRDPIDKIVSSYFFTRSGSFSSALNIKAEKHRSLMVTKRILSILTARALPLWLWSLIYKMRSCHSYFTNEDGQIIVDYLGSTDRLSLDLVEILGRLGYTLPEELSVPHTNTSQHKTPDDYRFFRLFIPFLRKRYSRDTELYRLVQDGVYSNLERIAKAEVAL